MKTMRIITNKIKGLFKSSYPQNNNLSWFTVESGILKGEKLFGDTKAPWLQEMQSGIYDKEFFDYLQGVHLKNKTIIEVGAHVGYHSLAFAKIVGNGGKVYAFEPNPFNSDRLIKNIDANPNLKDSIKLFDFALSDKNGNEEFVFGERVDKGSSSGSFLRRAHTIWDKSIYESEKIGYKKMNVVTRTLDSLREDGTINTPPTVCKIDVEGAEYLVLEGAKNTLHNDRPVVLIEIHSIFNMCKVKEIFDRENYSLTLLKEESDGRCFFIAKP